MNWTVAIERNREALKRLLATLVAMAGFAGPHPEVRAEGEPRRTLPRHLHRAVLRLLRPAESAARRLVIVAARGLVVTLPPPRLRKPKPNPTILRNDPQGRNGTGILLPRGFRARGNNPEPAKPRRRHCLPLFDRMRPAWRPFRPVARCVPRISLPGFRAPSPLALRRRPSPDDLIDAGRLNLRLAALASALDDLPGHTQRFARWQAVRDAAGTQSTKSTRVSRTWPLRPGRPPGGLKRPVHDVHDLLNDIHGLAYLALERPDTS